jgi:hypothetical protein
VWEERTVGGMDVLFSHTSTPGAVAAAEDLERRGHRVVVCHPDGGSACVGLTGGVCPLDADAVDAAVAIRPVGAGSSPGLDDGIICAARRGIPVVVGGDPTDNPFGPWTAAEEEGSRIALTVETVVRTPDPGLSLVATHALRVCLERHGLPLGDAHADVRRRDASLDVTLLNVGDADRRTLAAAGVRVAGALRAADQWARRIDVHGGASR